jgi:hypothetical protein
VVHVQVRAQHQVHLLRGDAGGAEIAEVAALPLVPQIRLVPDLVVAHAGVYQYGVTGSPHDPGLDPRAHVPGHVVEEVGLDPAVVLDDPPGVGLREHLGGGKCRAADLDDPRDRDLSEREGVHVSLLA